MSMNNTEVLFSLVKMIDMEPNIGTSPNMNYIILEASAFLTTTNKSKGTGLPKPIYSYAHVFLIIVNITTEIC